MITDSANKWTESAGVDSNGSVRVIAWATTGLFAALMTVSGILYLVGPAFILQALRPLGYPPYFRSLLGSAKLLGVVGLLLPGRPSLREWAYAGFTFDLVAAVVSHLASGEASHAPPALAALALLSASYVSRHRLREERAR